MGKYKARTAKIPDSYPPPRKWRISASPDAHDFQRNRQNNEVCVVCQIRRVIARDGTQLYHHRGGEVRPELPKCGIRITEFDRITLEAVRADRGDGLTAAQLVVILAHMGEEKVRASIKRLNAARHLAAAGLVHANAIYSLAPKGAAYLAKQELIEQRRLNPAPKGRPRIRPIGAPRKSYYKPTGRPMGRPPKLTPVEKARAMLAAMRAAKPRGRAPQFEDEKHVRQREASRRWREARARGESLPRKTIASLTPQQRAERTERHQERQRRNATSWRRWNTATRLADRHLAASPPEADVLSSYALEWLGRAA